MEQINRVIDLFPGCGGLTQGFVDAGFTIEMAIENDPISAASYRSNFGDRVLSADVGTIPEESLPNAEVVIGTPPCTLIDSDSWESAETRNMWNGFERIVDLVSPQVFVLAGVPGLLESLELADLATRAERGGELEGYRLASGLLDATSLDSMPARRWAVVVGTWTGVPSLPVSPMDASIVVDLRNPDGYAAAHAPQQVTVAAGNDVGGIPGPLPTHQLSGSTTGDGPALSDAARLRTFPDDFMWHGSPDQIARQIEQAFPPQLATVVARHIRDVVLTSRRVPNVDSRVPASSALSA